MEGASAGGGAVDVLIVTAADGEDEAVRAVEGSRTWRLAEDKPHGFPLDLWRGELPIGDASDGVLQVALVKAFMMGPAAAAHAAGALTQHLAPGCIAMCGVCAGRPGWTNLGDVIVADRVYQYDAGELVNAVPGGRAQFNADLMTYPFRAQWKQAAEKLVVPPGTAWLAARPLPRDLQREWVLRELHGGRNPSVSPERYARCPDWKVVVQALEADALVEMGGIQGATLTAAGRTHTERLMFEHADGIPSPSPLAVHVGPLGTGSALIRDVDIWDRLSSDQRLLRGFDMEAAVVGLTGFLHEIPWIVVKGVMDFGEPGRTQGFRLFAARAAAEVLLGFLRAHLRPAGSPAQRDPLQIPERAWRSDLVPPGALLRADSARPVPFHGRTAELAELSAWSEQDAPFALRLVTGPGGMGKTRLLIEACRRLRAAGWRSGFLPARSPDAGDRDRWAHVAQERSFVVIDYAETRNGEIEALLRGLDLGRLAGKVRIVLLARSAGEWWEGLGRAGGGVGDVLSGPSASRVRLLPAVEGIEERRQVFERACQHFQAILGGGGPPPLPAAGLAASLYERVLLLNMSALAAMEGVEVDGERGLLDWMLRRERGFWSQLAAARGLDSGLGHGIGFAMAAITLNGGIPDLQTGRRMLEQLPVFAREPQRVLDATLRLLREAYPGDPAADGIWVEPLLPDLLGEHLVGELGDDENSEAVMRLLFSSRSAQ
jgi:nucleoside phosphorylase